MIKYKLKDNLTYVFIYLILIAYNNLIIHQKYINIQKYNNSNKFIK